MKKDEGFTLIELLIVVAIILTLLASSGVFYSRFLTQNSVSAVSDQFAGELRKAQIYAMEGRQNTSWGVSYASNTITLFATGNPAFNETFSVNTNITVSGITSVTFARATGIPSATPTITISGSGNTKTVAVNAQGTVTR